MSASALHGGGGHVAMGSAEVVELLGVRYTRARGGMILMLPLIMMPAVSTVGCGTVILATFMLIRERRFILPARHRI